MRAVRRWRPYPIDEACKLYLPFYKYGAEQTKIWDISGNQNHGTISGAVPAIYPMLQSVASGSVTQANMKISAVNGTAFVDFSTASVLTDYLDHLLVIKDSSGRVIQGFIKAAGTGDTLGGELVTSWGEAVGGDPFDTLIAVGGDITSLIDSDVGSPKYCVTNQMTLSLGMLLKLVTDVTLNSGVTPSLYMGDNALNFDLRDLADETFYFNLITVAPSERFLRIYSAGSAVCNLSCTFSLKQVLTPSATGVTIVSTKGGAAFNWTGKDASFKYNDSSGYIYTIYSIPVSIGLGWFGDGVDDRFVHSSLNLGTIHTLHYWLLYQGISGVIHGGAASYHGLRLTPTACGYNVGTTEVTVTHSAAYGQPVLFSIDRNGTSVDFYKNGVKIGATQTLLANTAQVLTDFFRYSGATSYWNGILFDAININTNKGAQEIRNFFELTRAKYGQ